VTFEDPVLPLLPASEAEIIEKCPSILPDYLRRRIRALEFAGKAKNCRGIIYELKGGLATDEDLEKYGGEPKTTPEFERKRTCKKCRTRYTGILKNFGFLTSDLCNSCKLESRGAPQKRTCKKCGKTYTGISRHFRQRESGSIPGVRRFKRSEICKKCENNP
jgi:hypothetical protein